MGKIYSEIDDRMRTFIEAQKLFFVATAPSGNEGHVNCSPKGLDALRVIGSTTVAYVDYVGSGAETIAHLRENGRITVMFCALEDYPKIVRLHGHGTAIEPTDERFASLLDHFSVPAERLHGVRAVIVVEATRISDSCGHGVPLFSYQGERTQLPAWIERKGSDGLTEYQREHNASSIDGLSALRWTAEREEA